jgi:BON domain
VTCNAELDTVWLISMKPRAALAIATLCVALHVDAQTPRSYLLDPFAQATSGHEGCPPVKPPLLDEQQMRSQAHSRAERGTSCCLAGTCECGGPYKHDAEINDRVVEAIGADKRFRDPAVWVTTTRGFVSLQGCVRSQAQKNALGRAVKRQAGVVLVWNEVTTKRPGK